MSRPGVFLDLNGTLVDRVALSGTSYGTRWSPGCRRIAAASADKALRIEFGQVAQYCREVSWVIPEAFEGGREFTANKLTIFTDITPLRLPRHRVLESGLP
jgi:hypothetical protein